MYTFHALRNAILHTNNTVAKLLLRAAQVLVRVGEVLDFVVELLFHLGELLGGETAEVD